jgi:hypothetical protein
VTQFAENMIPFEEINQIWTIGAEIFTLVLHQD